MEITGEILLGFGANLPGPWGSPEVTIGRSIEELRQAGVRLNRISKLIRTRALGPVPQPDFVNALGHGWTQLPATSLLSLIKRLEAEAGRLPGPRWGPRPLDIDILDFAGTIAGWDRPHDPQYPAQLILPHPEMHKRAFVLEPLVEVAPNWRHPIFNKTAAELLKDLG